MLEHGRGVRSAGVGEGRQDQVEVFSVEAGDDVDDVEWALVEQRRHHEQQAAFTAGQDGGVLAHGVGVQPGDVAVDRNPWERRVREPAAEGAQQQLDCRFKGEQACRPLPKARARPRVDVVHDRLLPTDVAASFHARCRREVRPTPGAVDEAVGERGVLVLLFGAGFGVMTIARAALLGELVPLETFAAASGRQALAATIGRVAAPAVAGAAITSMGYTPALIGVAVCCLIGAGALVLVGSVSR